MRVLMAENLSWESVFRVGSHAYAEMFKEKGFQVGWLSAPFHPVKFFTDRSEFYKKLHIWREGGQWVDEIWEYAPFIYFPYRNYPIFRSLFFNKNSIKFSLPPLLKILQEKGWRRVNILWLTNISDYSQLLNFIDYEISVYRASDLLAAFDVTPPTIEKVEEEVANKVDYVLAASHNVFERLKKIAGERVYYIPNGYDERKFSKIYDPPTEFQNLGDGRKIIYVGAIDSWFDVELLEYAASKLVNFKFILIGKCRINLSRLLKLKNVHYLGPRSPQEIPRYLIYSDVGIIPFKKTPLTDAINPIKLYEYTAAGIPTVSTNLEEVKKSGIPVYISSSADEFVHQLEIASELDNAQRESLKTIASGYTWSKRKKEVLKILGIS